MADQVQYLGGLYLRLVEMHVDRHTLFFDYYAIMRSISFL